MKLVIRIDMSVCHIIILSYMCSWLMKSFWHWCVNVNNYNKCISKIFKNWKKKKWLIDIYACSGYALQISKYQIDLLWLWKYQYLWSIIKNKYNVVWIQ
jgi:hypothetical protein